MQLTVKQITNLPSPEKGSNDYSEPGGLRLRVYPTGRKAFYFIYRFEGKLHWYRIGEFGDIALKDAREECNRLATVVAQAKLGKCLHPKAQQEAEKIDRREAPTVSDLADEYLTKWAKVHKKSWKEDERILEKDVLPKWGKRLAREITRRDVRLLLEEIGERKRAEDQLRTSEELYRSIVENSHDGIVLVADDYRIVYGNSEMARIRGTMRKELSVWTFGNSSKSRIVIWSEIVMS